MKAYGAMKIEFHAFLTSALYGSEWSASQSCRFTTGDRCETSAHCNKNPRRTVCEEATVNQREERFNGKLFDGQNYNYENRHS
jgi:hypothetical protein